MVVVAGGWGVMVRVVIISSNQISVTYKMQSVRTYSFLIFPQERIFGKEPWR